MCACVLASSPGSPSSARNLTPVEKWREVLFSHVSDVDTLELRECTQQDSERVKAHAATVASYPGAGGGSRERLVHTVQACA